MELKDWESVLTISAIVSAAGFFGWKIIAGWLIVNLEVAIETTRQSIDKDNDWLAITLLLKKGNTDALWLKDIVVRIYDNKGEQWEDDIRFHEYNSLPVVNGKITRSKKNQSPRKYTIAPEEIFRYARVVKVPGGNEPLTIEAAVFGKRAFWPKGFQWRSSAVSLPVKNN